jgi:glyoxylate/hydroxypyruvate reductase A
VLVTPHVASATPPDTAAEVLAANIKRMQRGEQPYPIVHPAKGY